MSTPVKYTIEVDENGAGDKVAAIFRNGAKTGFDDFLKQPVPGRGPADATTPGGGPDLSEALKPITDLLFDIRTAMRTLVMGGTPPGGSGNVTNNSSQVNVQQMGSGGGSLNLLHTTNNLLFDMLLVVKSIAMNGGGGSSGGGQGPADKAKPQNRFKRMVDAITKGGHAALGGASDPSGATGEVSGLASLATGPVGISIAAITALSVSVVAATKSLDMYDAGLFEASTEFTLVMEGLKYQLALDLSEPLSNLTKLIGKLIASLEPIIVVIVELIDLALEPVINVLIKLAEVVGIAIEGLKVLYHFIMHMVDKLDPTTNSTNTNLDHVEADLKAKRITPNEASKRVTAIMANSPEVKLQGAIQAADKAMGKLTGAIEDNTAELKAKGALIIQDLFLKIGQTAHQNPPFIAPLKFGGAGQAVPNVGGMLNPKAGPNPFRGIPPLAPVRPKLQPIQPQNNFTMNHPITMHASDYDRLYNEMIQFTARIWDELRGMHGTTWMRMATARRMTGQGIGV